MTMSRKKLVSSLWLNPDEQKYVKNTRHAALKTLLRSRKSDVTSERGKKWKAIGACDLATQVHVYRISTKIGLPIVGGAKERARIRITEIPDIWGPNNRGLDLIIDRYVRINQYSKN